MAKVSVTKKDPKKEKEESSVVEKTAKELLELIGIKAKVEVTQDLENSSFLVGVDAPDEAGLLIGSRGRTMLELQSVLSMIVKQRTGSWYRIILNVGDWREKENSKLEDLARQAADRALQTKEPQFLYNLTPSQRRTVHLFLSTSKDVETKSEGEDEDRYLIVSPK